MTQIAVPGTKLAFVFEPVTSLRHEVAEAFVELIIGAPPKIKAKINANKIFLCLFPGLEALENAATPRLEAFSRCT